MRNVKISNMRISIDVTCEECGSTEEYNVTVRSTNASIGCVCGNCGHETYMNIKEELED